MRVYLLNPPFLPNFGRGARWQEIGRAGTLYYPIWLSYAAANISRNHEVRLIDAIARKWDNEKVLDDIILFHPDIIIIDSSFPSLNNDIKVANFIKLNLHHDALVGMVGPPTSQYQERIFNDSIIDFIARYEYDFTLLEVADLMDNSDDRSFLENIKGISYRKNDEIIHNCDRQFSTSEELDQIPFVSKIYKEHLNISDYFLGQSLYPEIQILTGRGCPNNCTFCSWPKTLTGKKYRTRSISSVIEELKWIQKNLNVQEVFFEDDTFSVQNSRVMEFCEEYRKNNLYIVWSCNARVNSLNYKTMLDMKKANCRLLIAGYESGSNEMLDRMKKGITIEESKIFANNAKKAKLMVHGDFVIGLPGENQNTINSTIKLINQVKPEILQVSVASPFPGTEFYEWTNSNNFLETNDPNEYLDQDGHQKSIVSYPNLSADEIDRIVSKILKDYYLSFRYIPIALRQILRKNGFKEAKRIYYSAKMFLKNC